MISSFDLRTLGHLLTPVQFSNHLIVLKPWPYMGLRLNKEKSIQVTDLLPVLTNMILQNPVVLYLGKMLNRSLGSSSSRL